MNESRGFVWIMLLGVGVLGMFWRMVQECFGVWFMEYLDDWFRNGLGKDHLYLDMFDDIIFMDLDDFIFCYGFL